MNSSINKYDTIEKLIYDEQLKIETIKFHPELDVMLVILNSKAACISVYLFTTIAKCK